jgi:hypothetical protein
VNDRIAWAITHRGGFRMCDGRPLIFWRKKVANSACYSYEQIACVRIIAEPRKPKRKAGGGR